MSCAEPTYTMYIHVSLFCFLLTAVEYKIEDFGSIWFFLAPNIDDEETAQDE